MGILLSLLGGDLAILVLVQLVDDLEAVELLIMRGELVVLAPCHLVDDFTSQFRIDFGVCQLRDHPLRNTLRVGGLPVEIRVIDGWRRH